MSHHINKLLGNETTILTNLKSRVHILCNNPTARALKGSRAPKLDYMFERQFWRWQKGCAPVSSIKTVLSVITPNWSNFSTARQLHTLYVGESLLSARTYTCLRAKGGHNLFCNQGGVVISVQVPAAEATPPLPTH